MKKKKKNAKRKTVLDWEKKNPEKHNEKNRRHVAKRKIAAQLITQILHIIAEHEKDGLDKTKEI